MRFLLKQGVLDELQQELSMTDQEFSDHLGVSRSSLWRAKLPASDDRFSLGQDVIAKIVNKFPSRKFEEIFFLDQVSHECDNQKSPVKGVG